MLAWEKEFELVFDSVPAKTHPLFVFAIKLNDFKTLANFHKFLGSKWCSNDIVGGLPFRK